jgi:hypothetical protein
MTVVHLPQCLLGVSAGYQLLTATDCLQSALFPSPRSIHSSAPSIATVPPSPTTIHPARTSADPAPLLLPWYSPDHSKTAFRPSRTIASIAQSSSASPESVFLATQFPSPSFPLRPWRSARSRQPLVVSPPPLSFETLAAPPTAPPNRSSALGPPCASASSDPPAPCSRS